MTQNEMNNLKKELEEMDAKLRDLNEEELEQVVGGMDKQKYTAVLNKIGKLLSRKAITSQQGKEIFRNAKFLSDSDYTTWAREYAREIGIDPSEIMP